MTDATPGLPAPRHEGPGDAEAGPGALLGSYDPLESALLETLLVEAPVAFAFYDQDLRYRKINRMLAQINGRSIEAHIGHRPTEILAPALGRAVEDMLASVLASGEPVVDPDFRTTAADGSVHYWQSQWFPARVGDAVRGVAVIVIDVTERRLSEDAVRRASRNTQRLQDVTARLATVLTADEVAHVVSELGRSAAGATWAGMALLDEERESFVMRGDGPTGLPRPADGSVDVPVTWPTAVGDVLRSARSLFLEDRAQFVERFPAGYGREAVERSDEHAWACLPVSIAGTPIGALRLSFDAPRTFEADERAFLEALAGQCSIAMERARLYERERRTAGALARSLIPSELPEVPGLELAARYLPGGDVPGDDAQVGGDWYDVFTLPSGRIALVVGDVMGKGVVAAAGMGRIRSALRALALVDESPQAVLSGLDRLVEATEPIEQIITLVYVVVDAHAGYAVAADAGHPPIAHVSASGAASLLNLGTSTPLGLRDVRVEVRRRLSPGDLFLAYSDGLVETRGREIGEGMDLLVRHASRQAQRPLPALLDDLVEHLLEGQRQHDDVTLLGLRVLG